MYSRSTKGVEKGDPNLNPWLAKMGLTGPTISCISVSGWSASKFMSFFQSESHYGNKRPQCTKKGSFFVCGAFVFHGVFMIFFFMFLTRFCLCYISRFRMSLTVFKILRDQYDKLCFLWSVSLLPSLIVVLPLVFLMLLPLISCASFGLFHCYYH
jgi:hypothetical protein